MRIAIEWDPSRSGADPTGGLPRRGKDRNGAGRHSPTPPLRSDCSTIKTGIHNQFTEGTDTSPTTA